MAGPRKKISSSRPTPSQVTRHFFKVYFPSLSLHSLKIPRIFIKKLNGFESKNAILKDPLERLWHVEVKRLQGDLYFENGWEKFVKYNCLKVGEFLVFRYVGNTVFYVAIFDNSGCEKEDSLDFENHILPITTQIITPIVKKEVESDDDLDFTENINKTTSSVKEEEIELDNETPRNFVRGSKEEECKKEISKTESTPATDGDEDELPHFTASVKQKTNYSLLIPQKVATQHDINIKPNMILRDPSQRSWPVAICFKKDKTAIRKGWWAFVTGNNLTPGDKCIFVFNKYKGRGRNSNVINVYIVRGTGEWTSAPSKAIRGTI